MRPKAFSQNVNPAKMNKRTFSEKITLAIDRAVGIFNPKKAYERQAYREAYKIRANSSYRGADKGRLYGHWLPGGLSADEDLLNELPDLRGRSRDLMRNDPHAAGIKETMVTNVIGVGIKPQSRVKTKGTGINRKKAREFQDAAESVFEEWTKQADAQDKLDFYGLQRLIFKQFLMNGEAIVIPQMVNEPHRTFSTAFQVVESDRLATPSDLRKNKNIRDGVEIGKRGEPKFYYIQKTHPGDVTLRKPGTSMNPDSSQFIKYAARNKLGYRNILHIYDPDRSGQTRGLPFLTPVINYFKDKAEYIEAEIVAAKVAACFAVFIEKPDAFNAVLGRTSSVNSKGERLEELQPGIMEYLNPGEKVSTFNPNRPGNTFGAFMRLILESISTSLGLPYILVAKDFKGVNYSSARAALLQAYRLFTYYQQWLARCFCQLAYDRVQEEAFLRDRLPVDDFYEKKSAYCRVKWIPQGWEWVDPLKEAQASKMAIETGVSTLSDEAAGKSRDWEENLEQIAREKAKKKQLEQEEGISFKEDDPKSSAAAQPDKEDPEEEEEEVDDVEEENFE